MTEEQIKKAMAVLSSVHVSPYVNDFAPVVDFYKNAASSLKISINPIQWPKPLFGFDCGKVTTFEYKIEDSKPITSGIDYSEQEYDTDDYSYFDTLPLHVKRVIWETDADATDVLFLMAKGLNEAQCIEEIRNKRKTRKTPLQIMMAMNAALLK